MKKSTSAPGRAALLNIKILVLDNDPRMLGLVQGILSDLGFKHVFTGSDGKEGLSILDKEQVHLIITDWTMQPMDGIDFVKRVRSLPDAFYRVIPIILLTARAEEEDVIAARDAGVTEFIAKPFTVKRLVDRIIAVVDNPRNFVLAPNFRGHDRRRRDDNSQGGIEKRKRRKA